MLYFQQNPSLILSHVYKHINLEPNDSNETFGPHQRLEVKSTKKGMSPYINVFLQNKHVSGHNILQFSSKLDFFV